MIKNKFLPALCIAACVSAAQADVSQGSNGDSYVTSRDPIIAASIGGGYFFDLDEAYAVGAFGMNLANNDLLGIQVMYMSSDEDFISVDVTTVGLVYKGYQEVGSNGGYYFSASAGVAFYDVDGKSGLAGISGSDESFYIDGSVGYQQFFSENVAFNIGLRLLHLDDADIKDDGVRLKFKPESVYLGLEAGLTFRF